MFQKDNKYLYKAKKIQVGVVKKYVLNVCNKIFWFTNVPLASDMFRKDNEYAFKAKNCDMVLDMDLFYFLTKSDEYLDL